MKRVLIASVLATALLAALPSSSSVAADRVAWARISVEGSASLNDATMTFGEEPTTTESEDPEVGEPARFESLWLLIVAAVGLFLLVGIVRTQRRWDRSLREDEQRPNESRGSDLLEEE